MVFFGSYIQAFSSFIEVFKLDFSFRYEFPEKLDLTEFVESPEETPTTYTLHAVLVHSGEYLESFR